MATQDEQELLDRASADAKQLLVYHGVTGHGDQGPYINASVGRVKLHCHGKRGLSIYLSSGTKGSSDLVYSENKIGDCTARYMPLVAEAMRLMRSALVLDELARI
jgi:hypothetical protein